MRITPPRLGWAPDWARAGPAATSDPRRTPARSRQDGTRARRAMARSPVLERDVVIDREKERNGPKSWPIILGGEGLSMWAAARSRVDLPAPPSIGSAHDDAQRGLSGPPRRSPGDDPADRWLPPRPAERAARPRPGAAIGHLFHLCLRGRG